MDPLPDELLPEEVLLDEPEPPFPLALPFPPEVPEPVEPPVPPELPEFPEPDRLSVR